MGDDEENQFNFLCIFIRKFQKNLKKSFLTRAQRRLTLLVGETSCFKFSSTIFKKLQSFSFSWWILFNLETIMLNISWTCCDELRLLKKIKLGLPRKFWPEFERILIFQNISKQRKLQFNYSCCFDVGTIRMSAHYFCNLELQFG